MQRRVKFAVAVIIAVTLLGIVSINARANAFSKLVEYYGNNEMNIESYKIVRDAPTIYNGRLTWRFSLDNGLNNSNGGEIGISAYMDFFSGEIVDVFTMKPY